MLSPATMEPTEADTTLSATQRTTFEAIFDTFAPGDGAGIPSASELGAVPIAEAMLAAEPGFALRMFSGHQAGIEWVRGSGTPLQAFVERCETEGYGPGRCSMAALHIMGSARMGGSADMSAVNPDGATWEVPNLLVADASTFPTASGVNPMISIEAIAHMTATRLAARLT